MQRATQSPPKNRPLAVEWTAAMLALLGVLPDAELAKRLGVTRQTVRHRRWARGLPSPQPSKRDNPRRWKAEEDRLLGMMLDRELAERSRCSLLAVFRRRRQLGVKAFAKQEVSRE